MGSDCNGSGVAAAGGHLWRAQDVRLLNCQELLGKVCHSVAEEAKKVNLVIVTQLSKVESEMLFMDHHDGYRLAESSHRNHHRL